MTSTYEFLVRKSRVAFFQQLDEIFKRKVGYIMKKDFITLLNNLDGQNYMYCFLTYLLSPVITGVKPSSTITLKKEMKDIFEVWEENKEDYLNTLGLESMVLKEYPHCKTVLVYNRENLKRVLLKEENQEFLHKIGYSKNASLEEFLKTLKVRYNTIHCPHELGIFLGIPLYDVKAFMECSEEKCLTCRYWKVYKDEEMAENIFRYYDKSKELVMNHLLSGLELSEIISKIYNSYNYIIA